MNHMPNIFFYYYSENTRFDISCESFARMCIPWLHMIGHSILWCLIWVYTDCSACLSKFLGYILTLIFFCLVLFGVMYLNVWSRRYQCYKPVLAAQTLRNEDYLAWFLLSASQKVKFPISKERNEMGIINYLWIIWNLSSSKCWNSR